MTALDLDLTSSWLARDEAALAPTLSRYFDIVAASGEGSWLIDIDGRRWLDLTSGIAVTNTGHCHPQVVAAIVEQASQLLHTSVVTHHQRNVELAERIGRLTPWFAEPQVFFCNSGAEAVDGSLKMARRLTGRPGIIAFRGGFHGRTFGGPTLPSSRARSRRGYEPLLSSVTFAPYGRGDGAAALAKLDLILST